MKINHNIAAIKSNMKLQRTGNKMSASIERLSSGYRINKAADDAAGMAISQKMKTQIRGLEQASRNASDGVSVVDTAEGALIEVEAMLQRMRELSVQAANDTYTDEDREQIHCEIQQLSQEIDRISNDTEFNTKKLLNGDADRQKYTNSSYMNIVSISDGVPENVYDIEVVSPGTRATITGSPVDPNGVGRAPAQGTIAINGQVGAIPEGASLYECFSIISKIAEAVDVEVSTDSVLAAGSELTFTSLYAGTAHPVEVYCSDESLKEYLGLTSNTDDGLMVGTGTDAEIECGDQFDEATLTIIADGNNIKITQKEGFEMKLAINEDADEDAITDSINLTVLDAGPIVLQVGANEGQTIIANIPRVDTETLNISNVNVRSREGASKAIDLFDAAVNYVSSIRAKLGAYSNRLDHSINSINSADENMEESLSRIEDLDMAKEMTNYTSLDVLQQAGTSMLSQANQMPHTVLNLLQG
ncbi:MAG: flagellin [Lachnospiraceae bacterium]|nr:flagellin [Lachnospiraceae bacterium]